MSETSIICSNLSFSWPDDTPLFEDLSFTVGDGRTGLVAPNGAGKSTLLKLIAGEYRPSAGSVTVEGSLGYLPQTLPFDARPDRGRGARRRPGARRAERAGVRRCRRGACSPRSATTGTSRSAPVPSSTGSASGTSRSTGGCGSLSGGEVVSLGLAAATAEAARRAAARRADQQPRPRCPRQALRRARRLQRVRCCWSATTGCCSTGWTASPSCAEAKSASTEAISPRTRSPCATAQRVAESNVRNAEQQLKREKRQMQQARERAARRSGTAARNVKDAGLPKIIAGAMKRSAQESAGRIDDVNAARVDDARARLDEAERALRDDHVDRARPARHRGARRPQRVRRARDCG